MAFKGSKSVQFLLVNIHAGSPTNLTFSHICNMLCQIFWLSSNGEDMETHYAHLIDDKAFKIISSFALDLYENGCSIITCSFNNDFNCIIFVGSTCPTKGSQWFVSCNEVFNFYFSIHSWFNFSPKNVSCVSMNKMLNMYMGSTWVHCSRWQATWSWW